MTRAEHLQWCKDRAVAYIEKGELQNAFASMVSDMSEHPETECPKIHTLGLQLLMNSNLSTASQMEKWINGFN